MWTILWITYMTMKTQAHSWLTHWFDIAAECHCFLTCGPLHACGMQILRIERNFKHTVLVFTTPTVGTVNTTRLVMDFCQNILGYDVYATYEHIKDLLNNRKFTWFLIPIHLRLYFSSGLIYLLLFCRYSQVALRGADGAYITVSPTMPQNTEK